VTGRGCAPPDVDGSPPSSLAVTVSPMRRRHLRAVLAIEAQVYPRPWSQKLFDDELDRRGRVYLVARVGPTVVGYAGLLMIADDGHVATVAVDPAWQRHGIATRLLAQLVREGRRAGAAQLTLEVRASNAGAQELYRRFGFAPAGARKGYYGDNGEDAIVMWAHDVGGAAYEERLTAIEAGLPSPTGRQGFDGPDGAPIRSDVADAVGAHPAARPGRMGRR
jgi:[ribosomal protein S18]-alanine N-acetyltransferase